MVVVMKEEVVVEEEMEEVMVEVENQGASSAKGW